MLLDRRLRSFQECGALRQDRLKGINVLLRRAAWSSANWRELDARERAGVGAQVPSRNQVASRSLMVDLGRGGEGQFDLWGKMEMQIEVFFGASRRRSWGSGGTGTGTRRGRRRRHHQEGERLGSRRGKLCFIAILQVECADVVDAEEESWILIVVRHAA